MHMLAMSLFCLLQKDIKDRFDNNPKAYLDNMVDMTNNVWLPEASNWTYCDPEKNQGDNPWSDSTKQITKLCPMEWARDMNQLDCSFVWKDYDSLRDYSGEYFEGVTGEKNNYLVQKLIAMSGVRMAAILNEIYDPPVPHSMNPLKEELKDETNFEVPSNLRIVKQG